MKKLIFSSLIAVLMLGSCQNENKKEGAKTDTVTAEMPPPPLMQPTPDSAATDTIYDFVSLDHPPTYPGGIEKLYQFLGKQIKYPPLALKKKVEGNVHLSFTVEKDGSINDIKVEQKLGFGTDEEAIRALKMSKKWNPGMENNKPVRVKYNIPIKFALDK